MGLEPSSSPLDKRAFERFTFSIDTLLESSAYFCASISCLFFHGTFQTVMPSPPAR